MSRNRWSARPIALVVVALLGLAVPAGDDSGVLHGALRGGPIDALAPVVIRTIRVPDGSERTAPCGPDGVFVFDDLPTGAYRIAVETAAGAYLAAVPVAIAPGGVRSIELDLRPAVPLTPAVSAWQDSWYSAMIVIGAAVVLGVALEIATEDEAETPASPS